MGYENVRAKLTRLEKQMAELKARLEVLEKAPARQPMPSDESYAISMKAAPIVTAQPPKAGAFQMKAGKIIPA